MSNKTETPHGIGTEDLVTMWPEDRRKELIDLRANGSKAAPGFAKPEGIVCFHVAANAGFKKTLEKDEVPKSFRA